MELLIGILLSLARTVAVSKTVLYTLTDVIRVEGDVSSGGTRSSEDAWAKDVEAM